jgi:hypothetical protein
MYAYNQLLTYNTETNRKKHTTYCGRYNLYSTSLSNIIADKNVDEKPRRLENSKNIFFLENLDLELMNDLENSVNKFSLENSSQASSANFL